MATTLELLKSQDLVQFAREELGQEWKRLNGYWAFRASDSDDTPSLMVYENGSGWYDYSSGKGGTIVDLAMHTRRMGPWEAIEFLAARYGVPLDKKARDKQPKRSELWEDFETYRLKSQNSEFLSFLAKRWFSYEFLKNNPETVAEVAREVGTYRDLFLAEDEYASVVIFPCLDESAAIVGAKLRRVDGEKLGKVKSLTIKGGKTGLLYRPEDLSLDRIIIVEGEADYLVLKLLGFKSVIGNLGGASAGKQAIGALCRNTREIVSFYDSDEAGQLANSQLRQALGRSIRVVHFPEIDGKKKLDVNDLYRMGFGREDFDKMIDSAIDESITETETAARSDSPIVQKNGGYYILQTTREGDVRETQITNFTMRPKNFVIYEDRKALLVDVNGQEGEFSAAEQTDVRQFGVKLKNLSPMFSKFGMFNSELETLWRYLLDRAPVKTMYNVSDVGYIQKLDVWIFDNGVVRWKKFFPFDENKTASFEDFDLKYSWFSHSVPHFIENEYYDSEVTVDFESVFEYLFSGIQGYFVLGYFIASMFAFATDVLRPFPILFVTGKAKSGKTTALQIAMKTMGFTAYSADSIETSTNFVDQKDLVMSHNIPVWRDEYKNVPKVISKDGFIKSVYDRSGFSKGRANLTTVYLPVNGTLLLSGQQTPIDEAVFQRICLINVSDKRPGADLYQIIQRQSDRYPSMIRWYVENRDVREDVKLYREILAYVKTSLVREHGVEKRLNDAYSPFVAGYLFFKHVFHGEDFRAPHYSEEIMPRFVARIEEKRAEEIDQDEVSDFFGTILDCMVDWGSITFDQGFIRRRNGTVEILFNYLHKVYEESKRRRGHVALPRASMKKYILSELDGSLKTLSFPNGPMRGIEIKKTNEAIETIIEHYENRNIDYRLWTSDFLTK